MGSVLCIFTLFAKRDNKLLNTMAFVICARNFAVYPHIFILFSREKKLSGTFKMSRITIFQKVAEGVRDIHL